MAVLSPRGSPSRPSIVRRRGWSSRKSRTARHSPKRHPLRNNTRLHSTWIHRGMNTAIRDIRCMPLKNLY